MAPTHCYTSKNGLSRYAHRNDHVHCNTRNVALARPAHRFPTTASLLPQGPLVPVHVHVHEDLFTDIDTRFLGSNSIRILVNVNVNGYRSAVNVYGLTVNVSGHRT